MDKSTNISLSSGEFQYTINIIKVPPEYEDEEEILVDDSGTFAEENAHMDNSPAGIVVKGVGASILTPKHFEDFSKENVTIFCANSTHWEWGLAKAFVNSSVNFSRKNLGLFNSTNCSGFGGNGAQNPVAAEFDDIGEIPINWWGLIAIFIVLLTILGNIMVILAISWDRRLQNMTNYFLLSLAATDLMVAIFVMPVGIVVLVLGK